MKARFVPLTCLRAPSICSTGRAMGHSMNSHIGHCAQSTGGYAAANCGLLRDAQAASRSRAHTITASTLDLHALVIG